jgi:hypothetical protein
MKKRILIMSLAIVLLFALIPVGAEAATTAPARVTAAMKRAVTENGRVIVVDNANSKVYLFKDGKLKKSFRCTTGDYINPNYHYFVTSGGKYIYKEGGKTYQYGIRIDCHEKPLEREICFHSYGEKKGKTYKSVKHNPNGIGCCIDNAAYLYRHYNVDGTAVMGC